MSEENNNDRFLVGFIIGSSVATIVSLIAHPQSGAKTRQVLSKTSKAIPPAIKDFASNIEINGQDLPTFTRQKWHNTLRRVRVAIDAGIKASKTETKNQNQPEQEEQVEVEIVADTPTEQ